MSSKDDNSGYSSSNDARSIFYNLPTFSSEARNCRPDLNNKDFMICNVSEKKIVNIDGKNVETYEDRQERVPINYKQINYLDPVLKDDLKSATSNFIDDAFKFGQEAAALENNFKRSLNSLNSMGFFDTVLKEADKAYNHFQKIGEQFESVINQGLEDAFENRNLDMHEDSTKQTYSEPFRDKPQNTRSDQETYDV